MTTINEPRFLADAFTASVTIGDASQVCVTLLKSGKTDWAPRPTSRACVFMHMNSRTVISILEADGWREVAHKGSHVQFKDPTKPGRVTVPHPLKGIPIGTLRSVEKQSGLRMR